MLTPERAVVVAMGLCLLGALATLAVARWRTAAGGVAFGFTAASAGLLLRGAFEVLGTGAGEPAEFLRLPALGFALRIHVDGLSAWFLILAAVIALPAMAYAVTYMRHYADESLARFYPYFLLFLAAMYGLVTTTDMMWFFFIFWQMMTLAGFGLIRFERRVPAHRRAARKFLVMMQLACAVTMIGAELLAVSSAAVGGHALKYDFHSVSATLPALLATRPQVVAVAFGLFLLGFGIKLGLWPFGQVWLPDAHPAAPSPVSAMLSGVMIKTGVYGILRYFLWLVPASAMDAYPLRTWGAILAGFGTVTLVTGTVQALRQEETKRLLAFHSIGQVGYIVLGTGACLALLPVPGAFAQGLAALALAAALFHTLNHGLFKSLLFLNAGSILYATGTQDLNRLGGLLRWMPMTAVTMLIASFSIAGVPLFNGFASKWALYVATIRGGSAAGYLPLCGLLALITSLLTLASFIKFFGASLGARTSALVAQRVQAGGRLEVGWAMLIPQVVLAAGCVVLGIAPGLAFHAMAQVLRASPNGVGSLLAASMPAAGGWGALGAAGSWFVPATLIATLGIFLAVAYGISRLGRAARRADAGWYCGYAREGEAHRYSAHHFYGPIKAWLGALRK